MRMQRIVVLAALFGAALPLAGQEKPAANQEPAKESRTAYLRRLYAKDRASYVDACRAILGVVKDEHSDAAFADLQKDLLARGIVLAEWELTEDSPLTKGTLSYMTFRALDLKGGLTIRLFGLSRRYALRECYQLALITRGSVDEYVTGRELIDVVTNAGIYKLQGNLDSQRK